MKRILSVIIAVVMIIGTMASVSADGSVAKVGATEYSDLQAAIDAAAGTGATVTLLSDVTYTTVYANNKTHWNGDLNYELSVGGNVVLDLNGYTITSEGGSSHSYYALICVRGGSLTIQDSSAAKSGAVICTANSKGSKVYTIYNNGALVLNGGAISNKAGGYAIESVTVSNTSLTINEGATVTSNSIAVRVCSQGSGGKQTAVINGGVISGSYALWVPLKNGGSDVIDFTISGGKLTGSSNAVLFNTYTEGADFTTDSVTISGGEFAGNVLIGSQYSQDGGNPALSAALAGKVISGGTFSNDVSSYVAEGYGLAENGDGTFGVQEAVSAVAKIGDTGYATFDEAVAAANAMSGEVTVEIYGKVEYSLATPNLTGAYEKINFVGKTADAEICITRNGGGGYISASKNVTFADLILSKAVAAWAADAGHMNCYFSILGGVQEFNNCKFPNGACARTAKATYTGCNFYNTDSSIKYSLWVYDDADITVDGCTFTGLRAIKMYEEGIDVLGNSVTIKNTDFSQTTDSKPAIVLTHGKSVTLEGNTYKSTGVFELDADGTPNGTTVTADIADIACKNDNYADCGVLVDGKIYISVADALAVATEGSTVTLMYDATETAEFPAGTTLDKNGYTAANVTVAQAEGVAKIGDVMYGDLQSAINAATAGQTVEIVASELTFDENAASIVIDKAITIKGVGKAGTKLNFNSATSAFVIKSSNVTFSDMTIAQGTKSNSFHISIDKGSWDAPAINYSDITIKNIDFVGGNYALCLIGENVVVDSCSFTGQSSHNILVYSLKGNSKINNNVFNASTGSNKSAVLFEGGVSTTLSSEALAAFMGGGTLTMDGNVANAKGVFFQFTNWSLVKDMNVYITNNKIDAFTNKAIAIYTENPAVASGDEFASFVVSENVFTNVPAGRTILKEYTGTVTVDVKANYLGSEEPDYAALLSGEKVIVASYYTDEAKTNLVTLIEADPEWNSDTDAGYYMVDSTKLGLMRFLFSVGVNAEDVTESGIKYIKSADITEDVAGAPGVGGTANAFYGDVTGIPYGTTGNYLAIAYVKTAAGTFWSDVVTCSPNFTQYFTEYTAQ